MNVACRYGDVNFVGETSRGNNSYRHQVFLHLFYTTVGIAAVKLPPHFPLRSHNNLTWGGEVAQYERARARRISMVSDREIGGSRQLHAFHSLCSMLKIHLLTARRYVARTGAIDWLNKGSAMSLG